MATKSGKYNRTPADEYEVPALRVPPHNVEAERGLLGSILLESYRVMDLCVEGGLIPESFYQPEHRLLFEALVSMSRAGVVIDPVTVIATLKASETFDKVGGGEFIQNLIDATPTSAHAEYYLDIVRQKFVLRTILGTVRKTEVSCYDFTNSADLILSQAAQAFLDISSNHQRATAMSWNMAVKQTMSNIDRLFSLGPGAMGGLSTGFKNLDKIMQGLRRGEMIVLAARPSQGKTSLAMNIAECVAFGIDMQGRPLKGEDGGKPNAVGVFSVEMSQESLAMRMLCGVAGVPGYQLNNSEFLNKRTVTEKLSVAASKLASAPIYVDDTGGIDVMELRARARRMKKQHDIQLIVIDYLQLLNHREFSKQGRQIETSQISANVKAMAKELNIPVIILSQLSRGPEQRNDKSAIPKCSDLRDSGAIEQDADVILLLRRPCKYPGAEEHEDLRLAIVDVAKHRNGPTGVVRLDFDGGLTRFYDRTDSFGQSEDGGGH